MGFVGVGIILLKPAGVPFAILVDEDTLSFLFALVT